MFAEIILNKTSKELNKVFDYIIPNKLLSTIKLGDLVLVPFGPSNKPVEGVITNIKEQSKFANKEILEITASYLTKDNIDFAKLMAKRYFCNDFECIKLMLPPHIFSNNLVKEKKCKFVYLIKSENEINADIENKKIKSSKHQAVLEYLIKQKNKALLSDLNNNLDTSTNIIKTIEKNGYIEIKEENVKRTPYENKEIVKDKEFILNDEQEYAYFRVKECIEKQIFQGFLLYGVTGSRKNRGIFATNKKCIR